MEDALELDGRPRCGLVLTALGRTPALRLAGRAEALGFDSLWVGDHVSFHVPIPDSLTLLAFAAAATERVLLGTAVYLLPLRHPTLAAKSAAMLDVLSGGRLVLGVGVGGEFPPEFEAVGVPVRERGARTDEAIPLLRRLWQEDGVVHAGRHFRFGPISLDPKPAQPEGPPLWVGGRSPAAMRRAGRLGDGYVSTMTSAARYRSNLETIAQHARQAGRTPLAFGTGAFLFSVLDPRFEAAQARAAAVLGRVYRRPFVDAARRYCLLGRPADCLERMRAFAQAGVRHFILAALSEPQAFAEQVAAEILPEVPGLISSAQPAPPADA